MICCGNKTKAKWMSELDVIAKTVIGSLKYLLYPIHLFVYS